MKIPLELIPPQFAEDIARVLLHGAKKYARHNWMQGISFEAILGGVQRHVAAVRRGEEFDEESGLPHVSHAACGLMFMHWYLHGKDTKQYRTLKDDRVFANSIDARDALLPPLIYNYTEGRFQEVESSPYSDG